MHCTNLSMLDLQQIKCVELDRGMSLPVYLFINDRHVGYYSITSWRSCRLTVRSEKPRWLQNYNVLKLDRGSVRTDVLSEGETEINHLQPSILVYIN